MIHGARKLTYAYGKRKLGDKSRDDVNVHDLLTARVSILSLRLKIAHYDTTPFKFIRSQVKFHFIHHSEAFTLSKRSFRLCSLIKFSRCGSYKDFFALNLFFL